MSAVSQFENSVKEGLFGNLDAITVLGTGLVMRF
jgi:hypothetical protein